VVAGRDGLQRQDQPVYALVEVDVLGADQGAVHEQVQRGRGGLRRLDLGRHGEALAFAQLVGRVELTDQDLVAARLLDGHAEELDAGC
jgi:hypothetical protein